MSGGSFWPDSREERLLQTCFAPPDAAREALRDLPSAREWASLDPDAQRLLPILSRRWGGELPDPELSELGQRIRLALWHENRKKLALAGAIAAGLRGISVDCLWLKGVALLLGAYDELGCRAMGDVDFLVFERDLERAVQWLNQTGWSAEDGAGSAQILRLSRIGHAWQFDRVRDQEEESCDLHWRPVVRCYSPRVTEWFWSASCTAQLEGMPARIPCPTDQLFHICVHGLEWGGRSRIRWVPDALTVLAGRGAIEWKRLLDLAQAAQMNVRMRLALQYLQGAFEAGIPQGVLEALNAQKQSWEQREGAMFEKPVPLGFTDSIVWHRIHFARIRPFDPQWSSSPAWRGFPEYLKLFLRLDPGAGSIRALWRQAWARISGRTNSKRLRD